MLEGSPSLEEGTAVRVEPIDGNAQQLRLGSPQRILRSAARWHGEPQEMDRLLEDLRKMKQDELLRQPHEDE